MHKDLDRALKRAHLTAKLAGMIARMARVKNLSVMHFSPKYREGNETPETEAIQEFIGSISSEQEQRSNHQIRKN